MQRPVHPVDLHSDNGRARRSNEKPGGGGQKTPDTHRKPRHFEGSKIAGKSLAHYKQKIGMKRDYLGESWES